MEAGNAGFMWQFSHVTDMDPRILLSTNLCIWLPLLIWFLGPAWLLRLQPVSPQSEEAGGRERAKEDLTAVCSLLKKLSQMFYTKLPSFKRSQCVSSSCKPVKTEFFTKEERINGY